MTSWCWMSPAPACSLWSCVSGKHDMNIEKCLECGGGVELVLASGQEELSYCIACAKKLGRELRLPRVAAAAEDAERLKRAIQGDGSARTCTKGGRSDG